MLVAGYTMDSGYRGTHIAHITKATCNDDDDDTDVENDNDDDDVVVEKY